MDSEDYARATSVAERAWTADLGEVAKAFRVFDHFGRNVIDFGTKPHGRSALNDRAEAERLAVILQARATLEAAEAQRTEARDLVTKTSRLVWATWAPAVVGVVSVVVSLILAA